MILIRFLFYLFLLEIRNLFWLQKQLKVSSPYSVFTKVVSYWEENQKKKGREVQTFEIFCLQSRSVKSWKLGMFQ